MWEQIPASSLSPRQSSWLAFKDTLQQEQCILNPCLTLSTVGRALIPWATRPAAATFSLLWGSYSSSRRSLVWCGVNSHPSSHPYLHLAVHLHIHILVNPYFYPFIHPSIYLAIHLSVTEWDTSNEFFFTDRLEKDCRLRKLLLFS